MNYQRLHDLIITDAKTNPPSGYTESHHILPRCMGGGNEVANRVRLSPRQHFIIHRLLIKIYPKNPKLWYAFNMMFKTTPKQNRIADSGWIKSSSNSRTYQELKSQMPVRSDEHKEKIRLSRIGRKHSSETIYKMQKPKSPETREKMRLAALKRWHYSSSGSISS